jgi:hypothetical protein
MAHGAIFFRKNPVLENMAIKEINPKEALEVEEWLNKTKGASCYQVREERGGGHDVLYKIFSVEGKSGKPEPLIIRNIPLNSNKMLSCADGQEEELQRIGIIDFSESQLKK